MAMFKEGDRVYIPSNINKIRYDVTRNLNVYEVEYLDATGEKRFADIDDEPGLLLTAEEVASKSGIDWQATYNEYSEKAQRTIAGLSKRITELNALLEDAQSKVGQLESALSAQNDANLELEDKNALQARENRELVERVSTKKGEVKHWRGMYMHMKARCDEYKRAADNLKAERDRADDELALTKIVNVALAEKIERMQNG